jgi:two-component system OmpR family sensor kinase
MTLRLRLLLVLVGVVAVGLLVADVVTYNQLDSFLYSRVDQELADSSTVVYNALARCLGAGPLSGNPAACGQYLRLGNGTLPPGTWGALLDGNGNLVGGTGVFFGSAQDTPVPNLPADLPNSASGAGSGVYFSAQSAGPQRIHYQVLAVAVPGGTLVVAAPTTEIVGTLRHLVWIETLVTLGVLGTLGTLSWWIVRRGLRPLDDMADTALAIAEGDLSRRVPDDGTETEVGRLGAALNTMLGNIEAAFAARSASEERLRRFLADASHELRTPLTSIRGYAEMFDRGAREHPEDLATSMFHIRREADRMSELVDDLLLLARLDRERPLDLERIDLGDVVRQSVEAAQVSAPGRAITLTEADSVVVDGDAGRLRQVLDNLLANAVRHTPGATAVEVRLRAEGPSALVEVQDHGPGVAPEDRQRIFEPFHRADASRARATGGMGLGLAIVAAITRAHGGSVGVRAGHDGGAVFWVRLPLARPLHPPALSGPPPPPAGQPPSAPVPSTVPSAAPPPWPAPAPAGDASPSPARPGTPSR